MFRVVLFCGFLLSFVSLNSQSFVGFFADNYSGVNSVIFNPASIADSRLKLDVNVAGGSLYAGNNYYGVNVFDALKSNYDFEKEAIKTTLSNNSGHFNLDVLGPSAMLSISPQTSVALFTRVRSFLNVPEVEGNIVNIKENFSSVLNNDLRDFYFNQNEVGVFSQSWAELGLSYAKVIKDNKENFFKGGVSLKYLQGMGSSYLYGENLGLENSQNNMSNQSQGELFFAYSDRSIYENNYQFKLQSAFGFGLDLGFVYEWRPDYLDYSISNARGNAKVFHDFNKYRYRLSISVTDLGFVDYKNGKIDTYNLKSNPGNVLVDDGNFFDVLDNKFSKNNTSKRYNTKLPTALHANVDWNLYCNMYVNFNIDVSLVNSIGKSTSSVVNSISLSPRYETKKFSAFMPLSMVHTSFLVGSGFRIGPVYIGSGSFLSAIFSNRSKHADIYAGFKIPIYQSSTEDLIKDKDRDGVIDKLDVCPDVAGLFEKSGCPEVKPKNKSIKKEEKIFNDEIALNRYLKMIFFDNGTSNIKDKSISALNNIVKILAKYPELQFVIEGHTDNQGSSENNQKLSEARANSIKMYLVEKGIDSVRLKVVGYGEDKPITDNDTPTGRAINRRVEMKTLK